MTTINKAMAGAFASRRNTGGGTRLDLLLPAGWPETGSTLSWCRRSGGDIDFGRGTLDELANATGAELYVWTPATETLLTRANVPTRSREKLMQALPFALEEQLVDEPASLHFAWRREPDGTLSVAVTNKNHLKEWLAALRAAGFEPRALSPAMLAVPWSPGSWSAAFVGNELMVRTGPVSGFVCLLASEPPALLIANLKDAAQQSQAPEYLILFQPPPDFSLDAWTAAIAGSGTDVPIRIEPSSFWNVPGDSKPALNLLQGEFAPQGETRERLRPWIPAGIMVALWLIGTIAFDSIEWWRLHRQHKHNTTEMTDLLMSAFPDTKYVDDPPKQMQRGIEQLQARGGMRSTDILPILVRAAPAWQSVTGIKLRSVRYLDRAVTLDVGLPNEAALEQFRQALQSNGLRADIITNTSGDGGVVAQLKLQSSSDAGKPS